MHAADFLTPIRCRLIFAVLMILNFWSSWHYLTHHCPIDLSGDEAQYWDWSRHLDLSYYSKGPMVAYIIRGSCFFLGETMPAVRLPALILAVGTSICTYWLTRKLFGSDRLALGAVLLGGIVPMYAAGGMLMTIDPPLFFFWALATCLAAIAIFDDRNWAWPAAGVIAGLGVLTKYAMLLWPVFILLFLLLDSASRRKLRTSGPWIMTAIALLFLMPIVIWNFKHQWVSLRHVASQTGADSTGGLTRGNLPAFLGAQFGAINPLLAVILIGAVVHTLRSSSQPHLRAMRFLLVIGGALFLLCVLDSLRAKVQVNWPAPAYFTLLILTAHFIGSHWQKTHGWFIAALIFGIAVGPVLRDLTLLYPLAAWLDVHHPRKPRDGHPQHWVNALDMEYKLRGMADPFASKVAEQLAKMPAGSFVLCEAYEDASELAFYLPGQPKTYFAGSYWSDLTVRRRWTEFDLWPDRSLDRPELIGRDAIYVGFPSYAPLKQSFASVEKLPDILVKVRGMDVQMISIWKCTHFLGMKRPAGEGTAMISRRHRIFVAIWCIAMVVALRMDVPIAAWVHDSGLAKHVQGTRWAECVKMPGVFWFNPVCCAALLLMEQIRLKQAIFVILCGVISGANAIVKWMIGRFRPYKVPGTAGLHPLVLHPFWHGMTGLFHQHDLSFPSGHACTSCALAASMIIVWPRGAWIFIVLVLAVCLERVAENAHYTSDVLGGVGLAALAAHLLYHYLNSWMNRKHTMELNEIVR